MFIALNYDVTGENGGLTFALVMNLVTLVCMTGRIIDTYRNWPYVVYYEGSLKLFIYDGTVCNQPDSHLDVPQRRHLSTCFDSEAC